MRVLLIGNKTDIPNKCEDIQHLNPDIIIRVNKCNSWYKTITTRTDIWLMDICREALTLEFLKIPQDCVATARKKFFFYENSKNTSLYSILCMTKLKDLEVKVFNDLPLKKYFPKYDFLTYRPSNFMWMLIYCLEVIQADTYITACDIEDRSYLKDNKFHKEIYHEEENLLKKLIETNKIHKI